MHPVRHIAFTNELRFERPKSTPAVVLPLRLRVTL